jgi:hypothetical protein
MLSLYFFSKIPVELNLNPTVKQTTSILSNKSVKKIDDALEKSISLDAFNYTGSFESPFRIKGERKSLRKSSANAVPIPDRPKLSLKGILQKDAPIAIVEDPNGETYIKGIGEKVLDQEIVKIFNNKVTLRDQRGTYDLMVEEK